MPSCHRKTGAEIFKGPYVDHAELLYDEKAFPNDLDTSRSSPSSSRDGYEAFVDAIPPHLPVASPQLHFETSMCGKLCMMSVYAVRFIFPQLGVSVDPVTEEHALLARQGYSDYGKGPIRRLNFCDCFSYASPTTGEPLLFKATIPPNDIQPALP